MEDLFVHIILHQREKAYGYALFHYQPGKVPTDFFQHWNIVLSGALSNMHKRDELKLLYEERRLSSITDVMTRLLNRRGLEEQLAPVAEVMTAAEPATAVAAAAEDSFCIVMASQVTERNANTFIGQLSDKGFAEARILVSGGKKTGYNISLNQTSVTLSPSNAEASVILTNDIIKGSVCTVSSGRNEVAESGDLSDLLTEAVGLLDVEYVRNERIIVGLLGVYVIDVRFHHLGVDVTDLQMGETPRLSVYQVVRKNEGVPVERRHGFSYKNMSYLFKGRKVEPFMVPMRMLFPFISFPFYGFLLSPCHHLSLACATGVAVHGYPYLLAGDVARTLTATAIAILQTAGQISRLGCIEHHLACI